MRTLLLAMTLMASTAAMADTVYKCTDTRGNPVFSSRPCDQVSHPEIAPLEVVEHQMTRLDQVDRKIANVKGEIHYLKMEMRSTLADIRSSQSASDNEIAQQSAAAEKRYNDRLDALGEELATLKDARNRLVEHSVAVFLDENNPE